MRVQTPRFCGFCSIAGTVDLAFCGARPLRISGLIVGMKPFTFRCRIRGGYFAQSNKREVLAASRHPAFTSLSNVQLLSGTRESLVARTGGHIAATRERVNRAAGYSIGASAPPVRGVGRGFGATGAGSPPRFGLGPVRPLPVGLGGLGALGGVGGVGGDGGDGGRPAPAFAERDCANSRSNSAR